MSERQMHSPPFLVAGMHRSGTSLVAAFLAALGVDMGERLLEADAHNPRGYFEDRDFRELHGRILTDCTSEGDGGHRDWGWTESEGFDRSRQAGHAEAARALVEARASRSNLWGWKDPRTSLLLDFWDEILEGRARYLLLYRLPWEVADSILRLGGVGGLDIPDYSYRVWAFYNRRLLEFYRSHRDRAALVSTNTLLRDPSAFVELLQSRFGLELRYASLEEVRDRNLFASCPSVDPLPRLWLATHPDCAQLLGELDAAADLSASGLWGTQASSGDRLWPDEEAALSVVILCSDQGELLVDALASVERSAPEGTEVIIVNDGSRQRRALEVLDLLRQGGYRILDHPGVDPVGARNRGNREARGRYVLQLDADKRLVPGFLEKAIHLLDEESDVGVVYGAQLDLAARDAVLEVPEFDLDSLLKANFIGACAVYRRAIWEDCGGYDPGAAGCEDWDLWISAAERGWRFCRLPEPHSTHRSGPSSRRAAAEREGLRCAAAEHIYRKHRALYLHRHPSSAGTLSETASGGARSSVVD